MSWRHGSNAHNCEIHFETHFETGTVDKDVYLMSPPALTASAVPSLHCRRSLPR